MKIYTKGGDDGTTALLGGLRLPKSHIRIEAYGTLDELNSHMGMLRDQPVNELRKDSIITIQERLFTIGAHLATAPGKDNVKKPDLLLTDVAWLEEKIDEMEESLPAMKFFILPGGHSSVSAAHIARCVCRRTERSVTHLSLQEPVENLIIIYLNRLSDYLFVLSRKMSQELKSEEIPWMPRK